MPQVIAGIYEINEQIGAGGGGIVYLGRHLRLEKPIVLKADKRKLSTKPEILRREVDMLKGLSHMYIPQVYDFVQEDGVVYTVMDLIEGESMDKLLKRGEVPSQPQVIAWACQILEALCYLHSRPPYGTLHGDIKPANIMVRPSGDICLIDYNIALALGEDGAVKAGASRGYASPEHYGMEYASSRRRAAAAAAQMSRTSLHKRESDDTETMEMADDTTTETADMQASSGSSTGSSYTIMLDVRSDIYSLGATLYHLLSGKCPAQDALEVEPLGPDICSPDVSKIIQRAMEPAKEMRYPSASEMLEAFRMLHKRDRRVLRRRKHMIIAAFLLSTTFLAGGTCSFVGLKQMEGTQEALALAEYSANSLAEGNVSGAVRLALQAIPKEKGLLDAPVTAQAQKALTDALGVYDLSDGFKALDTLELPSAPFAVMISPDSTYLAVTYAYEAAIYEIKDGHRVATLPLEQSALSDLLFIDETHIVYAGEQGVTAYDLAEQKTLWTGDKATTLALSGDRETVAAVDRDADHATIYRVLDGTVMMGCSFGGRHMPVAANDIFADPGDKIFSLNMDGSMLAVSLDQGGLTVFDLKHLEDDLIIYDSSDYMGFQGGFFGEYFAFIAGKAEGALFGLVDTKEAVYLGDFETRGRSLLTVDETGIYLANGGVLVRFDPDTLEEKELAYTDDADIISFSIGRDHILTAGEDASFSFFNKGAARIFTEKGKEPLDLVAMGDGYAVLGDRDEPSVRVLQMEEQKSPSLFSYDPSYPHDEARVSQDGETLMLFSHKGFCLVDRSGRELIQEEMPDPGHIYDQQFRRDGNGSWLEVTWYDGTVRSYSAADGSLLSEKKIEPPSTDLYEEFYTDRYRIQSPLHGTPQAYDLKTGRQVALLEEDSYLTYVTQVGDYILTEYISTSGGRYGLLLDGDLQTLARLPGLCDNMDGMLFFDYGTGDIRKSPIYPLQELVALGEGYLQENEKGSE